MHRESTNDMHSGNCHGPCGTILARRHQELTHEAPPVQLRQRHARQESDQILVHARAVGRIRLQDRRLGPDRQMASLSRRLRGAEGELRRRQLGVAPVDGSPLREAGSHVRKRTEDGQHAELDRFAQPHEGVQL